MDLALSHALIKSCQASWWSFLTFLSPEYQPPAADTMMGILHELDNEIQQQIDKLLSRNTWLLSADSATSKDQRLFTIDATNEDNVCLHVKTVHSNWGRQSAKWLKDHLKVVVDKVQNLASIAQDSAAACKAAFRMLHTELPLPKRLGCFEVGCCHFQQCRAASLRCLQRRCGHVVSLWSTFVCPQADAFVDARLAGT